MLVFSPPPHHLSAPQISGLTSLLLFAAAQLKQRKMLWKKIFLFIVAISTLSLLLHRGIHSNWYVKTETHTSLVQLI